MKPRGSTETITAAGVGEGHVLTLCPRSALQSHRRDGRGSEFALVDRRRLMHLLDHRNDLLVQVVAILADGVRRMRKQAGALAKAIRPRPNHPIASAPA